MEAVGLGWHRSGGRFDVNGIEAAAVRFADHRREEAFPGSGELLRREVGGKRLVADLFVDDTNADGGRGVDEGDEGLAAIHGANDGHLVQEDVSASCCSSGRTVKVK